MKIVIDIDSAGHVHFIETTRGGQPQVEDANNPGKHIDLIDMLASHNKNLAQRTAGGWMEQCNPILEPNGKTRWQRVVEACNSAHAGPDEKGLNLV